MNTVRTAFKSALNYNSKTSHFFIKQCHCTVSHYIKNMFHSDKL